VINLEGNADAKKELFSATEMYTLPQIFFNEVFIGGNSQLQALVKDENQWNQYLEMLKSTPAPEGAPNIEQVIDIVESEESVDIMDFLQSTPDTYKDLVREMQDPNTGISIADRMYHFRIYKRCFIGSQAVDWLCKTQNLSRPEAVKLGEKLREKYFFRHVVNDHVFKDKYLFYRFVHHETTKALNNKKLTLKEPKPAVEVAHALRKAILDMYDEFLAPDGKGVDYAGLGKSDKFSTYEEISYELQRTNIVSLPENERKAFFINIYNTLMIHAYVRNGFPSSFWSRFKFFTTNSYMIGGQNYSLDDIEHGVLRNNKRSLLAFQPPFSNADPRLEASIPLDPRIHFALVCGAKGCPPIKTYSAGNIDEELNMAAISFLESGCVVDGNKIYFSKILSWYKTDFGNSNQTVIEAVLPFINGEKKEKIENLLKSGNYKVSYLPYDWTTNTM